MYFTLWWYLHYCFVSIMHHWAIWHSIWNDWSQSGIFKNCLARNRDEWTKGCIPPQIAFETLIHLSRLLESCSLYFGTRPMPTRIVWLTGGRSSYMVDWRALRFRHKSSVSSSFPQRWKCAIHPSYTRIHGSWMVVNGHPISPLHYKTPAGGRLVWPLKTGKAGCMFKLYRIRRLFAGRMTRGDIQSFLGDNQSRWEYNFST